MLNIEGVVERVIYKNDKNAYRIIEIKSDDDSIVVVGELGKVDVGELLSVYGYYVNHPKYDVQFRAEYCEKKLPETAENIEKYLASGAIKGIGASFAKKIVDRFGKETFDIMENHPEMLIEIGGISGEKCTEIQKEMKKLLSLKNLTSFLAKYGIKPGVAMKIYLSYGTESMDEIKKNPYLMCIEEIGVEFELADRLADDLDIAKNSYLRAVAGANVTLNLKSLDGHTCLPYDVLAEECTKLLKIKAEDFRERCQEALDKKKLYGYMKNDRAYIYLPRYFEAEEFISQKIKTLAEVSTEDGCDCDKLIDDDSTAKNIEYNEMQREAIKTAVSGGVMILTGGPGTGKTTTLNAIISILKEKREEVFVVAPTGRAAKKISDITGHNANTIHRLLGAKFDDTRLLEFSHGENNPLKCDALIIDEMSMVDTLLFASLLKAVPDKCKLIMVGDSDQLPSVGAGDVLSDMIKSKVVKTVHLTEIFRQSQDSSIITNAHRIVSGKYPILQGRDSDFFMMRRDTPEDIASLVSDLVAERLPKAYNYSPINDIQVITPSKMGSTGTVELNKLLQARMNPPHISKQECTNSTYTFRKGDKVMQNKNDYNVEWVRDGGQRGEGIFNGDIGTVEDVNSDSKEVILNFDGKRIKYSFEQLYQIDLAYAVTVHKSQGCEFDAVVIPLERGFDRLSYRNLLYTAVTRAKKLLVIVGSEERVKFMVDNGSPTNRYTCLGDMLSSGDKPERDDT